MKHKLRVECKVVRKSERVGVVLVVLAKLLAEADQHAVNPSEDKGEEQCYRTMGNIHLPNLLVKVLIDN
jgi:hypothetical protein